MKSLQGKKILITGGLGFLGKSFGNTLSSEGAEVIVTDIFEKKLTDLGQSLNFDISGNYFQIDVTDESSIENAFEKINRKFGTIDVVINNAAINPTQENDKINTLDRLENYQRQVWQRELDVGLTGAFLMSKHYLKTCIKNKKQGNIINIASDLGIIAPNHTLYERDDKNIEQPVKPIAYSVVKHGLIGLTKYLATYMPSLIRANSISPGGVYNKQDKDFLKKIEKLIPLGRMAELEDLNGALILLCSDSSSYINGHNLVIDGGRTIW